MVIFFLTTAMAIIFLFPENFNHIMILSGCYSHIHFSLYTSKKKSGSRVVIMFFFWSWWSLLIRIWFHNHNHLHCSNQIPIPGSIHHHDVCMYVWYDMDNPLQEPTSWDGHWCFTYYLHLYNLCLNSQRACRSKWKVVTENDS